MSIRNDQASAISQGLAQQTAPLHFHHHLYYFTVTTVYLASAAVTLVDGREAEAQRWKRVSRGHTTNKTRVRCKPKPNSKEHSEHQARLMRGYGV